MAALMALPSLVDKTTVQAEIDALMVDYDAWRAKRSTLTKRMGGLRGSMVLARQRGHHESIPRIETELAGLKAQHATAVVNVDHLLNLIRNRRKALQAIEAAPNGDRKADAAARQRTATHRQHVTTRSQEAAALSLAIHACRDSLRGALLRRNPVLLTRQEAELERLLKQRDEAKLVDKEAKLVDAPLNSTILAGTLAAKDRDATLCQHAPVMTQPGVCPHCGKRAFQNYREWTCTVCGWEMEDDDTPRPSYRVTQQMAVAYEQQGRPRINWAREE
jgi:ribosomal protein L37AE/L43A